MHEAHEKEPEVRNPILMLYESPEVWPLSSRCCVDKVGELRLMSGICACPPHRNGSASDVFWILHGLSRENVQAVRAFEAPRGLPRYSLALEGATKGLSSSELLLN